MLRCQFLSHVLKALFFIKIALKLSYFAKKCKIFERWVLRPQIPKLRRPTFYFVLQLNDEINLSRLVNFSCGTSFDTDSRQCCYKVAKNARFSLLALPRFAIHQVFFLNHTLQNNYVDSDPVRTGV